MKKPLVCITDYGFANIDSERQIIEAVGGELRSGQCRKPAEVFEKAGVTKLSVEELFAQADILSLNLPLTDETRHFVNASRLASMKPHSIIVNTARGGLIDTRALADALTKGTPFAAGLDVFESEPLEGDHPLRQAPNALLTSHTAWFSADSVGELQRLAAEEAARRICGKSFKNSVSSK